jgi:hypothetical protein
MRGFTLIAAMATLGLLACSQDEARMCISVQSLGGSPDTPEVRVTWKRWPADHTVVLDSTRRTIDEFETGTSGTFSIDFTLLLDGAGTTTTGTVALPLRGDWRWGVDLILSEEDPTATCFGCMGRLAFDVDPVMGYPATMKLWVVWGGNSISNPVVY